MSCEPSKLLQVAKCSLLPQSAQNTKPENIPCRSAFVGRRLFALNSCTRSKTASSTIASCVLRKIACCSFEPFATDNYFEQYVYEKPTVFVVQGKEVVVTSRRLADALANLSEQRRTVLLMNFFLGYSEIKIGNEYGRSRSTVNYWKLAALKQLRKELEETEHEE